MDEQTLSLIEALAKLRASGGDLEEIKLANQKKVRTPEGVQKYDQPIGTIITKDMIEHAAKKASQAASDSLHKAVGGSSSGSASSSTSSNVKKTDVPNVNSPSVDKVAGVPGNQTSADIDHFYVSSYVNDPSKANMAWVQKKDGNWYQQNYKDGAISSETPLSDDQVNALVAMEKKGLIYTGHINDPEPQTSEKEVAQQISDLFDAGKTPQDQEVKTLIKKLQDLGAMAQQEQNVKSGNANSDKTFDISSDKSAPKTSEAPSAKTVKINGKDVKVGRYSRPKGFAKAFLIVHEDGTVEYENKIGARKKISHNAFDKHQELGMTKFLTSDTGPLNKDQHFEDGKLVNDSSSKAKAPAAKVEPMQKTTPETKSAPEAEKPAQETSNVTQTTQQKVEPAKVEAPKTTSSESSTVKIGNLTVKPGRYSRPKGFAKAFLIVHKDGTVEYENKKGERKKIGPKSFEGHWNLGINKFLTSDTGPLKKGESYENGKLVEETSSPESPKVEPTPSAPIQAAQKAAADLKAKQDSEKEKQSLKKETPSKEVYAHVQGNTVGPLPAGSTIYRQKGYSSDEVVIKYAQDPDGNWWNIDKSAAFKVTPGGIATNMLNKKKANGDLVIEEPATNLLAKKTEVKKGNVLSVQVHPDSQVYDFPEGSQVYVSDYKKDAEKVNVGLVIQPDGKMFRVSVVTGKNEQTGLHKEALLDLIAEGKFVKWDKYHSNDKASDNKNAGLFYVTIQGKPVQLVPSGTKVYHMSVSTSAGALAKFYQDDSGNWHSVSPAGELQANKELTGHIEKYLDQGLLVEEGDAEAVGKAYVGSVISDKTEAEKVVDSGKEISPPATPTEVKSVKISGMDIKPGKYSIGKEFAKAFLLVHPDGTTEYVNKKGESKKLTPAAFKKNWDAGMSHYAGPIDAAKGPTQAETPKNPFTGLKSGTYYTKLFDDPFISVSGESKVNKLEVMDDGSGVSVIKGVSLSLTPEQVVDSLKYGTVMDEFGNSAIIPNGSKPEKVHLFGSTKGLTDEDLQAFRAALVDGKLGMLGAVKAYTGGTNASFIVSYGKKYFPGDAEANKKGIIKAIDDILTAKGAKQADKPNAGGLPSPVKSLFKQDDNGLFIKPDVLEPGETDDFGYQYSSQQNQTIKKLSIAFDGKIASAPSKMGSYAKQEWMQAYLKGDFKTMYLLEDQSGMKMDPGHPGAPGNKDTHKISWAPAVAGELPAGKLPEGDWTWDSYYMTPEELDNYLIAANMANPKYLTKSQKKYWVKYHMAGDSVSVDKLSLKAQKAASNYPNDPYTSAPIWTEGVKPKKAYTDYVDSGNPVSYWPAAAITNYAKDYPEVVTVGKSINDPYSLADNIQNHVDTAKAEKAAKEAAELAEKMKPKFQKVPGQGVSGGHHEAMVLQDQFGQKWVYKPRDDENIFLADVEQASHDLARLWGYKTAKSFITEFDDRKGHVQQMFDAEKDLSGVPVSSLNASQIQDLAKEHLLDWALDNDDSWGANLLMLKNGSIVGIDKGRAFVGIGHWKGLTADSSAHVHMPLVYTDLYNAIANKSISQEDANEAYFAVIKQARKMQKMSDEKMTSILEEGFKNRKNWNIGGGPNSKEGAIKAAIDRKNSLVEDMETLWGNVFKKAGYDKPEPPENIVTNADDQEIHLGVTPQVIQQAKDNKSYGASAFFSGPEIEDAHMLLYHTKTKGGVDQLNGELKIRETSDAFKNVEKWLKDNAVKVENAYGFTPKNMKPELPNESDYWQKIVAAIKTISTHAIDGQYNEGSLNGMSWVKNTLQNYVNDYDSKMADPISQTDMVKQYKDPEAFLEMANKYLDIIHKAEAHKANGTKSSPGEFSQYVWTPKKKEEPEPVSGVGVKVELRTASSAKATLNGVPKFEEDGSLQHHHGYTTDGNIGSMYLVTLPTGETIEFRGNTTGTPAASKGLTRFTMPAGEDEAASLERIRAQMAEMGLQMNDANEDDLELFYWRHLANIMEDRADSKKNSNTTSKSSAKFKKFHEVKPVETAKMSPTEEIEAWRNAFANITSRDQIDQFVADGGHLPKFGHYDIKNPDKSMGQPYWERFDVTDDMWQGKELPSGTLFSNEAAKYVTETGGMLSTESRLRTLGMWQEMMSSSSDMSHGSSQFVFIRQNRETKEDTAAYNLMHVYYSPKILKRTHNYSFDSDLFGEMKSKSSQAYFDFDALTKHSGSSNELMVKHNVSLLDDIEIITFEDPKLREEVIQQLKDAGITEIRGVPVEKRFVLRNKNDILNAQKAVKEAWKS